MTLVCDEQLDEKVPKTDEGTEQGVLLGGRLKNIYKGLAAKITPEKVWKTTIHLRYCTVKKLYSLGNTFKPQVH